jgi:hypothetical protein
VNIHGDFIARLNWPDIATQLDREGYAVLRGLLKDSQVELRTAFYRGLAPIANRWRDALDISRRYPDTLDAFLMQDRKAGQVCMQSNLTRLRTDDYQALCLGGLRAGKLYGLFTCPSALQAIVRGGYVKNRVFFRDVLAWRTDRVSISEQSLCELEPGGDRSIADHALSSST